MHNIEKEQKKYFGSERMSTFLKHPASSLKTPAILIISSKSEGNWIDWMHKRKSQKTFEVWEK